MKIYLSSRYKRRFQMREHRNTLERMGYKVVSQWIDEDYDHIEDIPTPEEVRRLAIHDLENIEECDIMILFADGGITTHSTRLHEHGYAAALRKEIWLVGEPENAFQHLIAKKFVDWGDVETFADVYIRSGAE